MDAILSAYELEKNENKTRNDFKGMQKKERNKIEELGQNFVWNWSKIFHKTILFCGWIKMDGKAAK